MRIKLLALLSTSVFAASSWSDATAKLTPGARVVVEHKGKLDRGLYALSNADEIVIAQKAGPLAIPQAEVDRVTVEGTESPNLGYFANALDQLFPKPELVYERANAPAPAKPEKKRHWWGKR